jgi:hypothetical protein
MVKLNNQISNKSKRWLWGKIVSLSRGNFFYYMLYKAYWHQKKYIPKSVLKEINYFSAVPNRGAGIGHQMANWIAGYWFAKKFDLKFAHITFSSEKWERFLGFGQNEITVAELVKNQGYKRILLPLFNELEPNEIEFVKKIIKSYSNKKVIFIAEQDQFYQNQYEVMEELKQKFYTSKGRNQDHLIYSKSSYNIAIHVRRGDIVLEEGKYNPNLEMRWQNTNYFTSVLTNVLDNLKTSKPIAVYLFSQGHENDFAEFKPFKNIHYCLQMNAQDSFLHMVYADLLITSKSSFSYKPALISNGIKICPQNFWHGYPETDKFILADENGTFNIVKFINMHL